MATTVIKIKIDSDIKKDSVDLFNELGLDLSTAVNIFLHQCVLQGGIPFSIKVPQYKEKVLSAIDEAKYISQNPDVKSYDDIKDLQKAIND